MPTPTKRQQSAVESRSSCKCEVDGDVCDCTRPCSLDLSIDQRSYTDERTTNRLTKEEVLILENALTSAKQKLAYQLGSPFPSRSSCKCETDGEVCNCTRPCSLDLSTRSNSLDDRKGSLMQGDPNKRTQDRKLTTPGQSQEKGYASASSSKFCKECGNTESICKCSNFRSVDLRKVTTRDPTTSSKLISFTEKRPNGDRPHCPCEADGDDECSCDGCSLAGYSISPRSTTSPDTTREEKEFSCCSKRSSLKTGTPSKRPSADETYYSGRNGSSFDRKTSPKYEEKYKSPSTQVHSVGEIYNDLPTTSKQVPIPGKTYPDMVNEAKHVPIPGKTYPDMVNEAKHVPIPEETYHDMVNEAKHVPIPEETYHDMVNEAKHVPIPGKTYPDMTNEAKDVPIPGKTYPDMVNEAKHVPIPEKTYHDMTNEAKDVPIPGKTYPDMVNAAKHVPIPGKTYPDKDTAEKHVPMQGKTEHDTDTAAKHVPIQGDIFNDTSTAVKHIRSLGEIYNDQPTTSKNVSIQGEIYNDTDTAAKDGRKESAHGRNSTPRVSISSNNVAPDVSKLASRPGSRDSTSVSSRRLKSVSFPQNEELPGTSRLGESSKANLYATSVSYVTTSGCFHVDKSSATDKGKKEKGLSPEESIIIDVERMPGLLTGSKPSAESLLKKEQENRKGGKK